MKISFSTMTDYLFYIKFLILEIVRIFIIILNAKRGETSTSTVWTGFVGLVGSPRHWLSDDLKITEDLWEQR